MAQSTVLHMLLQMVSFAASKGMDLYKHNKYETDISSAETFRTGSWLPPAKTLVG